MNNFLKPTKGKTFSAIILIVVFSILFFCLYYFMPLKGFGGPERYGFPLTFRVIGCEGILLGYNCVNSHSYPNFVIDLIFWVVLSYIISPSSVRKLIKKKILYIGIVILLFVLVFIASGFLSSIWF